MKILPLINIVIPIAAGIVFFLMAVEIRRVSKIRKIMFGELGLGLARGSGLVCGDTPSDLPMLAAAAEAGGSPWSIFVTREEGLRRQVRAACHRSWFAGEPDVLVVLLNELGRESP